MVNRNRSKQVARRRRNARMGRGSALWLVLRWSTRVAWLGGMAGALLWLASPHSLPVQNVRIDALSELHSQTLLAQELEMIEGRPLLWLELDSLRDKLEALPWVNRVRLRRVWPDQLLVQVFEHVPVARWGNEALLSEQAKVFRPPPETLPEALPRLSGPERYATDVLEGYRTMSRLLNETGQDIAALRLDERLAWSLRLESGLAIELGREQPVLRLQRLMRVFAQQLAAYGDQMERVDLRYVNGFAVSWKEHAKVVKQRPKAQEDLG